MDRLLVTGASGFVGARVLRALSPRWHAAGSCMREGRKGLLRADLTDRIAVSRLFDDVRPAAVLSCAAMAEPDPCEKDPDAARALNAAAPAHIARECARRGARLIHVSTDLVFDGARPPYSESDRPSPLSVYGRTKLEGEQAVLEACPGAAVVRIALVYGRSLSRPSFLDWMLEHLAAGKRPKVFVDQIRTPTPVASLPDVFDRLARERSLSGVFHWAGADAVSRLQFGRAVCRVFGHPESLLEPVSMKDVPQAAPRPADVCLRTDKLRAAIGLWPWSLEDGLSAERYDRADETADGR